MYFYALASLGLALGLVGLLVIFSLLALAQKRDAPLERLESFLREERGRQGRLILLGEWPAAAWRLPRRKPLPGKAYVPPAAEYQGRRPV